MIIKILKFLPSLLFLFFPFIITNAQDCSTLDLKVSNDPATLIRCASPQEIRPSEEGRSLFQIIIDIANALSIIAVFLSIIGTIVGLIKLAQAGAESDKLKTTDAQGIITNSILAFLISAALWLIVNLTLNTLGIGGLAP